MSTESSPPPRQTLGVQTTAILRWNPYEASQLPEPDEELRLSALRDRIGHATLYQFCSAGIIEQRRDCRNDDEYDHSGHLWGTEPSCYRWVEQNIDTTTTPCGNASGIRTVESGETYTCLDDDCGCRFDYDTALEVVDG
jgi:hypothetical protein